MLLTELCVYVGFCKTKSEARRLIEGGGFRVNDKKITEPNSYLIVDKQNNIFYIIRV